MPGAPTVGHIVWNIPPTVPPNYCVFAVLKSADLLPQGDPLPTIEQITVNHSAFTFWDLFQRLMSDNDVALRNLHSVEIAPLTRAAARWVTLGWLEMCNPLPESGPARLEIDTSQASQLEQLIPEVDERFTAQIQPGERTLVPLSESLASHERLILRLRALVPGAVGVGETLPIDLRCFVGDTLICGYQHLLRVAPLAETTVQVLDILFAALRDVHGACTARDALALAQSVTRIARRNTTEPAQALDSLRRLSGRVATLAQSIDFDHRPECRIIRQRLLELSGVLRARSDIVPAELFVEHIRDLAYRIQEPAGIDWPAHGHSATASDRRSDR